MIQTPERVLIRFTKAGGHWAEIRERTITTFRGARVRALVVAIEYLVVVDGSSMGGEIFEHERQAEYSATLGIRIKQFADSGWTAEHLPVSTMTACADE
jgi:hypothetical protein